MKMGEEQERLLPVANVGKIMKQILPSNAKVSKEAKETMQECATEFISFVTSEASDKCHKENRKTVNGDDICWAMSSLGFDNYAEAIVRYLHKFREIEREKAIHKQNKTTNSAAATTHQPDEDKNGEEDEQQIGTTSSNLFEFRVLEKGNSSCFFTKPS
ncbi:nuclear transcription factor Y subunit B-4-like [Mercurialis annua]|uniref:nuclear transcription factor Y subunit B-4-like n=1 Tax=Mercurialis annua TaxID=3986 RepID=UPI00215F60B9|nr:nuclear transcription factor Y subunit B-4-like [Mercurialis annua]